MECPDCEGTGLSENNTACFRCDGVGELCDVCGEASDDAGMNVCLGCLDDDEEG